MEMGGGGWAVRDIGESKQRLCLSEFGGEDGVRW